MSSSFADLDKVFPCPYCLVTNGFSLEEYPLRQEELTVDCENCCKPINLSILPTGDGYELISDR